MMPLALVRRREIWVPTVWGWLVLLSIGTVILTLAARNLPTFLAINQPVGARILVVEGWMEPEGLQDAVAAFRAGGYERIVTTGAAIVQWPGIHGHATYAERAADYLRRHGLANVPITAVPAPHSAQDRTFLSAVMVREWIERSGFAIGSLDVFTSGAHARRSRLLYRMAFGRDVKIGVIASRSYDYDADTWWQTSAGVKDIVEQAVGLLWVKCCFWRPQPGSHEERWTVPSRERGSTGK
jgi:hypothetical protein